MQKLNYLTNAIHDAGDGVTIQNLLRGVYDRMSSQIFNSAAIAAGTTATKVKIAAAINYLAGGAPSSKAITDDFWTLSGVVADGKTNVYCFYIDSAGTASSAMGVEGTTVTAGYLNSAVKFPPMPEKKAMVGFVVVSASGGAFTGGTSNVATAGNFTVTFVNTVGMFDPTATI